MFFCFANTPIVSYIPLKVIATPAERKRELYIIKLVKQIVQINKILEVLSSEEYKRMISQCHLGFKLIEKECWPIYRNTVRHD